MNKSPEGKPSDNLDAVVIITLVSALAIGFGVFWVAETVFPSLNERWNVGPSFLGLVCAFCVFFVAALIFAFTRFRHAKAIAYCSCLGLTIPWFFHLFFKIWEFLRGGGI
jgi:apolipoprotein N-acyltransferase